MPQQNPSYILSYEVWQVPWQRPIPEMRILLASNHRYPSSAENGIGLTTQANPSGAIGLEVNTNAVAEGEMPPP